MTSFLEEQRQLFQEQRRNQKDAVEFLHNYRANDQSILCKTPKKQRNSEGSQKHTLADAYASIYSFSPDASRRATIEGADMQNQNECSRESAESILTAERLSLERGENEFVNTTNAEATTFKLNFDQSRERPTKMALIAASVPLPSSPPGSVCTQQSMPDMAEDSREDSDSESEILRCQILNLGQLFVENEIQPCKDPVVVENRNQDDGTNSISDNEDSETIIRKDATLMLPPSPSSIESATPMNGEELPTNHDQLQDHNTTTTSVSKEIDQSASSPTLESCENSKQIDLTEVMMGRTLYNLIKTEINQPSRDGPCETTCDYKRPENDANGVLKDATKLLLPLPSGNELVNEEPETLSVGEDTPSSTNQKGLKCHSPAMMPSSLDNAQPASSTGSLNPHADTKHVEGVDALLIQAETSCSVPKEQSHGDNSIVGSEKPANNGDATTSRKVARRKTKARTVKKKETTGFFSISSVFASRQLYSR